MHRQILYIHLDHGQGVQVILLKQHPNYQIRHGTHWINLKVVRDSSEMIIVVGVRGCMRSIDCRVRTGEGEGSITNREDSIWARPEWTLV